MQRKLDYEKIRELHSQNLNDNEISRIIGACVNGVRYARKYVMGLPNVIKDDTITENMAAIIVGTLLGDAWVGYVHSGCTMPKYQTIHCIKQELYTKTIFEELGHIMTKNLKYHKGDIKVFRGKEYKCQDIVIASSRNVASLIPYREAFYPEGKKVIPIDFIRDKFTAKSLAYWYMDDGSLDKVSMSYILNTQGFTRENLQQFIDYLYEKFNLEFSIKKDCSLYLRHKCNEIFVNLIKPYITDDMQYKIVSSLNSVKRGNS